MTTTTTGMTGFSRASFTRPADTTAYTAGDAVSDSTSAPSVITFKSVTREGFCTIQQAILLDSAAQATKIDAELWLFDTAPTAVNDNAAITFTDAELANLVGVIDFAVANVKTGLATAGAGGNAVNVKTGLNIPVRLPKLVNDLYGVLVVRNAYTPVSAEVFTITLGVTY
jgi:hypothetical protein